MAKPKPKADSKPAAPKAKAKSKATPEPPKAKSKVAPEPPKGGGQRMPPRGVRDYQKRLEEGAAAKEAEDGILTAMDTLEWLRGGWRERSLARLDKPLSPISRLNHGLLRLLTRRIGRIIVAWRGVLRHRHRHPAPAALTTNRHVSFGRRFIRVGASAGLGVCRRQSCEAMDMVRDDKYG
eukprot:jgi/Tetstr1/443449/TSEL_031460.t1